MPRLTYSPSTMSETATTTIFAKTMILYLTNNRVQTNDPLINCSSLAEGHLKRLGPAWIAKSGKVDALMIETWKVHLQRTNLA